jgi:Tfp pilus assembly protein PilF
MPHAQRLCPWLSLALAAAVFTAISATAGAKETSVSVKEAEQYIAKGDLKAAEIELKNAIRQSPRDPILRARIAQVYLQLGDAGLAEREARAARERDGDEADYLPILAEALLQQQKFAEIPDQIRPGDRPPALESKVRTALGAAAAGRGDREKAEAMWRDAIRLDPAAANKPKVQLARLLTKTNPEEADKLINEAIAASPRSAEPLQAKGEILQLRGDPTGAVRLFDEALKIDPKNLPAHLSRANVNIVLGNFPAADEDLDPILKAMPNQFMANYLRAFELAKKTSIWRGRSNTRSH